MPLIRLSPCMSAVVVALPKSHGLARRLISLGVTPGSVIRVLHNWGRGPLIVEVHGARLALGRSQAERVIVQPSLDGALDEDECVGPDEWVRASSDLR